ncbi:MAG TPA: hypothetical protein VGN32_10885, partial [Ktedonobacterales bacterium]|nr:hypothetical protein [Ktedonobacterales bacterium]
LFTSRTHVYRTLHRVHATAWLLVAILVLSLLLDVLDLVLLTSVSPPTILFENITLYALAIGIWGYHYWHLHHHRVAFRWHHAPAHHFWRQEPTPQ